MNSHIVYLYPWLDYDSYFITHVLLSNTLKIADEKEGIILFIKHINHISEAALQRCSYEKVFWKYVVDLPENTHAEVRFQ